MANDIEKALSSKDINNGGLVVNTPAPSGYQTIAGRGDSTPTITTIQDKYDAFGDDYAYAGIGSGNYPE